MKKLINLPKKIYRTLLFCFIFIAASSCRQKSSEFPINDNIAFPVKLLPIDSKEFLLVNSNASNKYTSGSIQKYMLDALGNPVLNKTYVIEDHGSDIALTDDQTLLALSFDSGKEDTKISFFDYSNKDELKPLPDLTLHLSQTEAKQSIKQIKFFKVRGFVDDFLYGVIFTSTRDTGSGKNIPSRTFVAKISSDRQSAQILFVLSYHVEKDDSNIQTLAHKSNSLKPYFGDDVVQYMLGSTAPAYDSTHDLFLALPTGSMNGFNTESTNIFPKLPSSPLGYFSEDSQSNPNQPCPSDDEGCSSDLRAVSLFAVDMQSFLKGTPLDLALYFVPLAWNANGIPYGHRTKNVRVDLEASKAPSPSDDITSFTFKSDFWASYLLDDKTLLVGKKDPNDADGNGSGNEIFQISGLDILSKNIQIISKADPIQFSEKQKIDFKDVEDRQIIDWFNKVNSAPDEKDRLYPTWPAVKLAGSLKEVQNPGPIIPYMFSRSVKEDGKSAFIKAPTVVYDFDVACTNNNTQNSMCFPYWVRSTYLGLGNFGRDDSWLTTQIPSPSYVIGSSPIFKDALSDPMASTSYAFNPLSGAQVCTTIQKKDIYCVSFLTGQFTKFHFTQSGFIPFG